MWEGGAVGTLGGMTSPQRANPLFLIAGSLVILVGLAMVGLGFAGFATIAQRYDSPLTDGRAELVGLAVLMMWGFLVITVGRILWRGARRRGAKDRVGRLLMIIALGFVAIAILGFLSGLGDMLGATTEEEARAGLIAAHIPYIAASIPALIIGWIGGRMANERETLLTVSTSADL
jgi:hypothetical protein